MHDDTLDRMTGLDARVSDTASDIIAAQILREGGGGPNAKPTRERVPLFADLLAEAPADAFFDFDAKHPGEVEAVAAFLSENGAGSRGSVKIDVGTPSRAPFMLTSAPPELPGLIAASV